MAGMKFHLRDILWMILIIAVALGWWRYRVARDRHLATHAHEVKYLKSLAPPIELIDEDLDKSLAFLSTAHGIRIDVDWDSFGKSTFPRQKSKVTRNLQEGSLRTAIEFIFKDQFEGQVDVSGTPEGILIVAKQQRQKEQPQ
jgi:hypothetical protein